MKKKFTLFTTCLLAGTFLFAGTPVLDGIFDGEGVWGAPVATADGNPGWHDANAKKLYVTFDNDYVYFGGEFSARSYQQFIFVVNTKDGGGTTDAWGRTITYNHSSPPDFLFRGDLAKSQYMEFHIWDGSAWTNTGVDQNESGTNAKGLSGDYAEVQDGFIEIRVPRSTIGNVSSVDAQFIIGGNNGGTENGHGCFDACPNDNNGTSWSAPGNATTVSNYAGSVLLPASLGDFAGELRGNTVQLQWNTLTESNLSGFGIERSVDARNWQTVGFVPAANSLGGSNYRYTVQKAATSVSFFRLKVTDKDGTVVPSKMVVIKSEAASNAELIGNPVQSMINVAIHTPAADRIQTELVDMNGRRVNTQIYNHPGGSSVMQIPVGNLGSGMYLLRLSGTETKQTLRVIKSL